MNDVGLSGRLSENPLKNPSQAPNKTGPGILIMDTRESICRELLTYLSHLPAKVQKDEITAAELALSLGNALLWIEAWLEPDAIHAEQTLDETAQTVFALGKQFRQAALRSMQNRKSADLAGQVAQAVDEQNARLDRMEKTMLAFLAQESTRKGGRR